MRALALAALLAVSAAAFAAPPARAGDGPVPVYVGVHLLSVRNFDPAEGTFEADFFLWARWPARTGDADPDLAALGLANGTIERRWVVESREAGRWKRVLWRVTARLHGRFPLERFPFDRQTLVLAVEHPGLAAGALSLQPDVEGTGVAPGLEIAGWTFERHFGAHAAVVPQGPPPFGPAGGEARSRVYFTIYLHRPLEALLAKLLLPLAVAAFMAHAAFFLDPKETATRFLLLGMALLVAAAAHVALAPALPDVDYLTIADHYFGIVYAFVLIELLAATWSHRLSAAIRETAADRLDRAVRWLLPLAAIGVGAALSAPAGVEQKPDAAAAGAPVVGGGPGAGRAPLTSSRPELVVGCLRQPLTLGPGAESAVEEFVTRLVMSPLVEIDATGVPRAVMASEVPSFDNGRVRVRDDGTAAFRWGLRPARWGDGAAVTADDVVKEGPGATFPGARIVTTLRGEVLVQYDRPRPRVIHDCYLFPAHRLKGLDAEGRRRALTRDLPPLSGPFILERFEPGVEVRLARNPHHEPPAPLERVVVRVYATQDDLVAAFRRGEIQLVPDGEIDLDTARTLAAEIPGAQAFVEDAPEVLHLAVNLEDPILRDKRVRKALLHAIDRESLVRDVLGGQGRIAHSWLPPQHLGADPQVARVPYDPSKAGALLDEAGLTRGQDGRRRRSKSETLRFAISRGSRHPAKVVEGIARTWGELGIEVQDDVVESGQFLKTYAPQRRWKHFALGGYDLSPYEAGREYWTEAAIPTVQNGWSGLNYSRWREPRMTSLYERIDRAFNPDDFVELLTEQQRIWAEELPVLTLYTARMAVLAGPGLRGVRPHVAGERLLGWNAAEWRFAE